MLNFRAGPEPLGSLLPAPVWANDPVRRPKSSVEHFRRLWALSSPRTRATRAAVLLLSLLGGYTLLLHASRWLSPGAASLSPLSLSIHVDVTRVARPAAHTNLTHLIVVPCNAIFLGTRAEERGDDESWTLHDYQRGRGRPASFWRHILEGARLVQADPHGLLVFSGGQTSSRTTMSEAESYFRLALLSGVFNALPGTFASSAPSSTDAHHGIPSHVETVSSSPDPRSFERATTEMFALDSFQNLLFSVARFHEFTGRYPEKITVVGYEMKRERFTTLHRAALRWPPAQFAYVGVDLDPDAEPEAWMGEVHNALEPYQRDLYGCHAALSAKRVRRNAHARVPPYGAPVLPAAGALDSAYLAPDVQRAAARAEAHEEARMLAQQDMVRALLRWCPPAGREQEEFAGRLPWAS